MPAEWLEPLHWKVLQKCEWIIVITMLIHTEPHWSEMLCFYYLSWGLDQHQWWHISAAGKCFSHSLHFGQVPPCQAQQRWGSEHQLVKVMGGRTGRVEVPCFWGKSALKSWGHYVNGITQFLEAMLIKYSLTLIILKLGVKRELKLSGIMAV